MPCLAASCAAVTSPRSASSATFALNSAVYRFRLPVIRVRPSRRRTELTYLSEIRGPPLFTVAPRRGDRHLGPQFASLGAALVADDSGSIVLAQTSGPAPPEGPCAAFMNRLVSLAAPPRPGSEGAQRFGDEVVRTGVKEIAE